MRLWLGLRELSALAAAGGWHVLLGEYDDGRIGKLASPAVLGS